jgi:hypothetical protein
MLAVTLMIVILLIFGLLSVAQLNGECFDVLTAAKFNSYNTIQLSSVM